MPPTKPTDKDRPLTFFVWADMHFGYNQQFAEKDIRWRALQQMENLAGWPYPPEIGGHVENPAMILVCGDFVTAGSNGEQNLAYYRNCLRQTSLPSYEALGNHEIGYPNVIDYFNNRYGGPYYSFDHGGVHFVALYQSFDAGEQVEALETKQLIWLQNDLASVDKKTPVVLFAHDDLDKQPNATEIYTALCEANVIMTISGHTHGRHSRGGYVHNWNGIHAVTTGHVRDHPIDMPFARVILVVKITSHEILVVPWRWDLAEWARHQGDATTCNGTPEHATLKRS